MNETVDLILGTDDWRESLTVWWRGNELRVINDHYSGPQIASRFHRADIRNDIAPSRGLAVGRTFVFSILWGPVWTRNLVKVSLILRCCRRRRETGLIQLNFQ